MEINVLKPTEQNEAEMLIVGLSRHPENADGWKGLEKRFDGRLADWIKSGLSFDSNSLSIYPSLKGDIPRVLFVGIGDRKN